MSVVNGRENGVLGKNLNILLADLHVVYSHLHNFHWNVVGPHFFEYHEHLQDLYENVHQRIDDVAEQEKIIGIYPVTNLQEYVELSNLNAIPSTDWEVADVKEFVLEGIACIINDLNQVIRASQDNGDEGTLDFAVEMLREQEKNRWFWTQI